MRRPSMVPMYTLSPRMARPRVDASAAGTGGGGDDGGVGPEDASGSGIDGDDIAGRLGGIHYAVDDERGGFKFLQRALLEDPLEFEVFHVGRSYLFERGVALALVAAGVGEPVLRRILRVEELIGCDLRGECGGDRKENREKGFHGLSADLFL